MKTKTIIQIYEIHVKDAPPGMNDSGLKVESHWNRSEFVVLEMLNGDRVTVVGRQLIVAVENAMRRP